MANVTVAAYAKNVLKSTGFIAAETIKGVNPTLTGYITDTISATKDMYGSVRDFKRSFKGKLNDNAAFNDVRNVKGNILDDIRTGKFYNPERERAQTDAYMKAEGFSFDDIDFDDLDSEVEDSSNEKSSTASAVERMNMATQKVTASSADMIVSSARGNAQASMRHNEQMFGIVNTSLSVINSSILNLHQDLAKPLNNHIVNSQSFYQTATSELAKQTKYLENISRRLDERFAPTKGGAFGSSSKVSDWDNIMGGGLPNIHAFGKMAKRKIIDDSGIGMLADLLNPEMLSMITGTGALSSPVASLLKMGLTSKIQKGPTGKALERMVSTMQGGFGHLAGRASAFGKKQGGLFGDLLSLLDITPKKNNKLDFGNYEKGRVDWNGMDDKALREVIPTQLANILSAITGEEAKIYNYKTGKWESPKGALANFKKERTANIARSMSGFGDSVVNEFLKDANKNGNPNFPLKKNSMATMGFKEDFDTLMRLLAMNGVNPAAFNGAQEFKNFVIRKKWVGTSTATKQYLIDQKNFDNIVKIIYSNGNKGLTAQFTSAVYNAQSADNRFMSESASNSSFAQVVNGSKLGVTKDGIGASLLNQKDDKGHTISWYLQNYYAQLDLLVRNISTGNTSSKKGRSFGNTPLGPTDYSKIYKNNNQENSREDLAAEAIARNRALNKRIGYVDPNSEEGLMEFDSIKNTWKAPKKATGTNKAEQKKAEKSSPISRLIDGFTNNMSDIILGPNSGGKSVIDVIKDLPGQISEGFKNAFESIKNKLSELWTGFKESAAGKSFFQAGKDIIFGAGKSMWNHAKTKAGNFWEDWTGSRPGWAPDVEVTPTAYRGGHVVRSGMVSVSEGEMIIPSEYNPYYNKHTNKSHQRATESMNYRNWVAQGSRGGKYWGSYAEGTPVAGEAAPNAWNKFTGKVKEVYGKVNDSSAGQAVSNTLNRINNKLDSLLGKEGADLKKEAVNTVKSNLPKTLASGAIGAIIGGATTGSALGLLGGFVVGAGTSIIQNSDKISKTLFGDTTDENGDWSKGKLPTPVANFIKKKLPGMAKSGGIGALLGTFGMAPGGILGGFAIGAGIDLLMSNEVVKSKVNEALFGIEDVNGKRKGGLFGMLQTRVVDPLSNFVKEGMKNIGGYLKKNFLDPVLKIFDPLKDWVRGFGKNIGNKIANLAKDKVKRTVAQIADTTVGRAISGVGKLGKKALRGAGAVASLPFKAVGKAADSLERHNVRLGYSSKNAKDRLALGEQLKGVAKLKYNNSGMREYNQALYDGKITEEDLANAEIFTNTDRDNKRVLADLRQGTYDKVTASLKNAGMGNPKDVKAISKLFNSEKALNGDYSEISDYLKNNVSEENMDNATLLKVQKYLTGESAAYKKKQEFIADKDNKKKEFLERTGLDLSNAKVRRQLDLDAKNYAAMKDKENIKKEKAEQKKADRDKLLKQQEEENPLQATANSHLSGIKDILSGIASKIGLKNEDITENKMQTFDDTKGTESKPKLLSDKVDEEVTNGKIRQNPITGRQEEWRNGKWEPDLSDAETKASVDEEKKEKEEKSKFFALFTGGGLLTTLKGLFSSGDKSEEKKETIWDKLKKLFMGEDGNGGIIGSVLGPNSVIGGFFGGLGGAGGLASLISGAIPIIGGAAGLGLLNSASNNGAGTNADPNVKGANYAADGGAAIRDAAKEKQSKMGIFGKAFHGLDTIGNTITGKNMASYRDTDLVSNMPSEQVKKTMAGNILTYGAIGTATSAVIGGTIGKIPIFGKGAAAVLDPIGSIKAISNKILDVATDPKLEGKAIQKVAEKAATVVPMIKDKVIKVITWACQKLGIKGLGESADDIALSISTKLAGASAKLAEVIPIIGWVIYGAKILNAITEGIQPAGAKVILGILDEPTVSQKLLAALANGINAAIPGIGGLIPTSTIVNIIYTVLSKCGVDFGNYGEQRENAKAAIEQYNAENGTTYNLEEYLFNVLGQGTIQKKIKVAVGNGIKNFGETIKTGATKAWEGIKTGAAKVGTGIKNVATKVGTGIKNVATNAWDKTKDIATGVWDKTKSLVSTGATKVGQGVDYAKDAFTALNTMRDKMDETFFAGGDDVIQRTLGIKPEVSEDNPLSGVVNTIGSVSKIVIMPQLLIKAIGKKIYNKLIKPAIDDVKGIGTDMAENFGSALKSAASGDFNALYGNEAKVSEDNPLGGFTSVINTVSKITLTPLTAISWVGHKIKDGIIKIKDTIVSRFNSNVDSMTAAASYVKGGDVSALWAMDSDEDNPDNPLGFISSVQDFSNKLFFTIPTAVCGLGIKIKNGFNAIKEKIKSGFATIGQSYKTADSYRQKGDLNGLWSMDSDAGDEENPMGFLSTVSDFGYKISMTIPTAFTALGNKINDIFTKAKSSFPDIKSMITNLWSYTDTSKDMSGFDSALESYRSSDDGLFGALGNGITNAIGGIMRMIVNIVRPFKMLGDTIGNTVDGIKEGAKETWNNVKDTASNAWEGIKSGANAAVNWLVGDGSGIHVSQMEAGKYGANTTLAQSGCGPAAAATVLRAYGRKAGLKDSARYAEAGGYVAGSSGVGTRASYFSDILGANGIRTSYTDSKADIRNAVGSGSPTILLGQDKSNTSKARSPFGPNPHYVVARGTDTRGNVFVDDPELGGTALYKKSILNNTKLGVMTGGDSGINITENHGAVWNYLKSAGLSDAGAAGLMGNLYAESGIKFNILENDAAKKYREKKNISYDHNSYTAAVDRALKSGNAGSNAANENPVQGIVPEYEFTHMPWITSKKKSDGTYWGQNGYGLVQWTTAGRKQGLYNLAKSKGTSISDPNTQLEFLMAELNNSYPGVLSTLKTSGDVKTASNKVLIDFEAPASKDEAATQNKRAGYGQQFYNQFTTNPPTNTSFGSSTVIATSNGNYNTTTGTVTSATSGGTATSGGLLSTIGSWFSGVIGKIGNALAGTKFGKAFGLLTGGIAGALSGSSNAESSVNVNSSGTYPSMGGVSTDIGNSTQENAIIQKMNSILGTCSYSMTGPRDPAKGSADCSSTVQWVLKNTINQDPGGDTGSIIDGNNGRVVDKFAFGSPTSKSSSGPNLNNLRPGDLMLYSRPDSDYSSGRTYRVGHVEMYMGNGKRAGHGSGTGPKVTDAMDDKERYILAKRYTTQEAPSITGLAGAGSGLPMYDFTKVSNTNLASKYRRNVGGDSGIAGLEAIAQKIDQMLVYLKQTTANTTNNAAIPTIVDILSQYGEVMLHLNNGSGSSTPASEDAQNAVNGEIASIMAKLDKISQTL